MSYWYTVTASESDVNVVNNTSVVNVKCYIHWDYGSYANDNPYWEIWINGTSYSGTCNFNTGRSSSGSQLVGSASKTIAHDSTTGEGSAEYCGGGTGNGKNGWKWSSTGTITLTTIARASAISTSGSVTLGNSCSVSWKPKSSSHKYKLKFSLGSWSYTTGYISSSNTSPYTGYTIPESVSKQLPNASSGTMSVELTTYDSSSNKVGSSSTSTFVVIVPSSAVPTISTGTISRVNIGNSTVDGWGYYIQGVTKATISATASGVYGSSIVRFDIKEVSSNVVGYTKSIISSSPTSPYSISHTMEQPISKSGSVTFQIVAVDSRGRSSTTYTSRAITVYEYSKPNIQYATVSRGGSQNTTDCVLLVKYSYSAIPPSGTNKNRCTCTFSYKQKSSSGYTTYGSSIPSNTVTTIQNILSTGLPYDFKIIVSDLFGNEAEYNSSTSTTAATIHCKAGGTGVAFGKMAETDNLFEVSSYWNSLFGGNVTVSGTLTTGAINSSGRVTGTSLKATSAEHLGSAASKFAVLDGNGVVCTRTDSEILSDIKAARIDLCWENSSTTSKWPGSLISTNSIGSYDAAIVIYKVSSTDDSYFSEFVTKGVTMRSTSFWNYRQGRTCTLSSSGITFGSGYSSSSATTNMSENNLAGIPYRIYGVKAIDLYN